jgi:glutaredoxin
MDEERKIKLYALSTCSHCKALKKLLEEGRRPFDAVDVDLLQGGIRRETLEEVRRFNKRCSFPTILIGDHVIVGYRENDIREALEL